MPSTLTTIFDRINAASAPDDIDRAISDMWREYAAGNISDADAEELTRAADKRRPLGRRHSSAPGVVTAKPLAGRLGSIFPRRRPQRSPDRAASRSRQRMLGGAGALPPQVRDHYTQGERAVLFVIAAEVKRQGVCDWPIDKIAAVAGVCRTTAQNAMREAQRRGHIQVQQRPVRGRKNLTNVARIVSREWLAWLKRGPIGFKTLNATKSTALSQVRTSPLAAPQGVYSRKSWGETAPPNWHAQGSSRRAGT